jgi:hypothetical protein
MAAAGQPLERARAGLREALELWDATDLSKIGRCQELLDRVCVDLRALIGSGGPLPAASALPAVAALRHDARRLSRLIDACTAFQQGLWLCLGNPGLEYGASGCVARQEPSAVCAVEG